MAGPHPIVGIASELADGRGRGAYQSDIPEYFVQVEEVLVPVVRGCNADRVKSGVPVSQGFPADLLDVGFNDTLTFHFAHLIGHSFQDLFRNIFHTSQEGDGQPFVRQFFVACPCPETVFQVIVFHRTVCLDLSVTAMVVGDEQPFCRDDFPGASAPEVHDRIFQAGPVHAVNVFCRKPEAEFLHLRNLFLDKHGQPHPFVRAGGSQEDQQQEQGGNDAGAGRKSQRFCAKKFVVNLEHVDYLIYMNIRVSVLRRISEIFSCAQQCRGQV